MDSQTIAFNLNQRRRHLMALMHRADTEVAGDFADCGQTSTEKSLCVGLNCNFDKELGLVEHARQKLATGSYGVCEKCHQPISDLRLGVVPEAQFCINCLQPRGSHAFSH